MRGFPLQFSPKKAKSFFRKSLGKHIVCPKCGFKKFVRKLKRKDRRYFCSHCRYKFSLKLTVGFKHSNLDYDQLYSLVWCFSQNKTVKDVIVWSNVSCMSARDNYSRLRGRLSFKLDKNLIWGHFICDECFVGKQKTENQAIVAGAVSHDFQDLRLSIIPDRDQDSIEGFLHQNIKPSSLITSDGLLSYSDIEWMGYGHDFEIHEKGEIKKTTPIERVWGLFKTFIMRTYHHIWKEKLQEYLVEFQVKFIHRKNIKNPLYLAKMLHSSVPNS